MSQSPGLRSYPGNRNKEGCLRRRRYVESIVIASTADFFTTQLTRHPMSYIPLQPLRVPAGWTIRWNTLFEEELNTPENAEYLPLGGKDLFFAVREASRRAIDVEFFLEQRDPVVGEYRLQVLKFVDDDSENTTANGADAKLDWDSPTYTFESSSRIELARKLDECLARL